MRITDLIYNIFHFDMYPLYWIPSKEGVFMKTPISTNLIPIHPTQALKYID